MSKSLYFLSHLLRLLVIASVTDSYNVSTTVNQELPPSPSWSQKSYFPSKTLVTLCGSILLIPIVTQAVSTWRFHHAISCRNGTQQTPIHAPVVPYWDVFLGHFLDLAWNTHGFVERTVKLARHGPVDVKAGIIDFTVVSNPNQIQKVFRACSQFSNKHMSVVALQNIFGASREIVELFQDTKVDPAVINNMHGMTARGDTHLKDHVSGFGRYARDYLSGSHLSSLSGNFISNLQRGTDTLCIQDDWVRYPDLFTFLQNLVSRATIEALMGSKIFEINPNIIEDFWTFERATPKFVRCFPRWMLPTQYKARDRIFDTLKKLNLLACQHISRLKPEDPDWEPYLGSKFLRARHDYSLFLKPLPEDTKAWEKMGIMFAANSNLVPTIFWYMFEALKDKDLRDRMVTEVLSCATSGDFNVKDNLGSLLEKPLLQSAYAETLRMRVAIAVPRTCEHGDFDLSGHKIEKNQHLIIFTWPTVQENDSWIQAGRPPPQPVDEFWAERYLILEKQPSDNNNVKASKSTDVKFSLHGLSGRWMPYGGGQHLCPGRHWAKSQIIGTFAFFFSQYEIELLDREKLGKVKPDMSWFPSGALPPKGKVPFRIKKREGKA